MSTDYLGFALGLVVCVSSVLNRSRSLLRPIRLVDAFAGRMMAECTASTQGEGRGSSFGLEFNGFVAIPLTVRTQTTRHGTSLNTPHVRMGSISPKKQPTRVSLTILSGFPWTLGNLVRYQRLLLSVRFTNPPSRRSGLRVHTHKG